MPKWASRVGLWNIVLMVILALPLLAHIYNGHFSRFMADDYCTTAVGLKYGPIGGALHWYNTWSGLYINFFIKSLIAPLGPGFAALLPAIIILSWLVATYWMTVQICALLRLKQPQIIAVIVSLLIVYATIDGAPALIQSVYWLGAAIPYTGPIILITIFIGLFVHALTHHPENRLPVGSMIGSVILALLIGGLSEIYMTFQVAALALASVLAWLLLPPRLKRPALSILVVSLIAAVIALMIVFISPGTTVRQSRFEEHLPLPELIAQIIGYALAFVASAMAYFAPFALLSTLGVSALLAFQFRPDDLPFRLYPSRVRWLLAGSLLFAGILVTAAVAPGVYAVSGTPPGRVYILPNFLLVLTAAFWGCLVGFTLRKRTRQQRSIPIFVIFAVLLTLGPGASLWRSVTLASKLNVFSNGWDEQQSQILLQVADGGKDIVVQPLTLDLAQSIGLDTIGSDATSSVNTCAADYYGIQTLIAE